MAENKPRRPLAGRVAKSIAWVSGTRVSVRVIGLINTAIVARILSPEDFGLVALAMSIWGLMETFLSLGVDTYLIKEKNPTREHFDTAWTFNVIKGLIIAAAIALSAPYLSQFLNDARLETLFYIISVLVVIDSVQNTGFVNFNREMDFSKEFYVSVSGKLLSIIVTVVSAFLLRSYFALIFGIIFFRTWRTLLTFVLHSHRPRLSIAHARDVFSYSFWLVLSRATNALSTRFDWIILQKFLGASAVGLFTVGAEIARIPNEQLIMPLAKALFPALSKFSDDISKLRQNYLESVETIVAVAAPLSVGIGLLAHEVVLLLLGDQWFDAVPIVRWLAWVAAIQMLSSNNHLIYWVLGQTKQAFYRSLLIALVRPGAFLIGVIYGGLYGALAGLVIADIWATFIQLWMVKRVIEVPIYASFLRVWRTLAAVSAMAAVVVSVLALMPTASSELNAGLRALAAVVSGGAVYCAVHLALWQWVGRPNGAERRLLELLGRIKNFGPLERFRRQGV